MVDILLVHSTVLLQRQLRHQPLQLAVLLLQFLKSCGLVQVQPAVFLPPAVERLHGDLGISAGLWGVLPLAISTSICRSSVTICSGWYRFIGISLTPAGTKNPGQIIGFVIFVT